MRPSFPMLVMVLLVSAAGPRIRAGQATGAPSSPAEANSSLIVSLLVESHDLDQQVPLPVHLYLLNRQINGILHVSGEQGTALTRQWANEMFTLAAKTKEPMRSSYQGGALNILATVDPSSAVELLRMAPPDEKAPPSPRSVLAGLVFSSIASSGGESALPLIEQQAAELGATGQYPYGAVAAAANQAVSKDNPQRAEEVRRAVFERAFARYSQSGPSFPNDYEFGAMLQMMSGALPFDVIQPALRLFVKKLQAADTGKYRYQAHVTGRDGQNFQTYNAVDAVILHFGRLILRDPELVQELEASRPEVEAPLECYRAGACQGGSFGHADLVPQDRVPDPEAEARDAVLRFSHSNPDVAISQVESMPPDEKQAAAELDLVRGIAARRPDQAAELLNKAQNAMGSDDARKQLNIISAQVSIAAAQNRQEDLQQLLQRGFQLAGPLVGEPLAPNGPPFLPGLPPMVQIGLKNYPDMTIEFLKNLPAVRMKAELLLAAVGVLEARARVPVSSRAQPPVSAAKQ